MKNIKVSKLSNSEFGATAKYKHFTLMIVEHNFNLFKFNTLFASIHHAMVAVTCEMCEIVIYLQYTS